MTDQLLHLSDHETVRIVRDTPEELEVEGTWTAGGTAPPPHLHPAQDEEFEIRSGRLTAVVDGVRHELGPGDKLEIPRGTAHKMWNAGNETATALWHTRPAGRTADWFTTIDRLTRGGTRKPPMPALAKAVTGHSEVFQLAVGPSQLRPLVNLGLRAVALADR